MAARLIALARHGAFPRLLSDGRLVVGYARGAGTPEMRAEVAEYLQTYHGGIVAELVAWAVSGEPPAPVCDDGAVPTQGPLGIVPAALLEGSEAALARLDHATQGALAAHSAHRDHPDRRIVITSIVHRDRESERSDEQAVQAVA